MQENPPETPSAKAETKPGVLNQNAASSDQSIPPAPTTPPPLISKKLIFLLLLMLILTAATTLLNLKSKKAKVVSTKDLLVEYRRSGGFAGFCDYLSVNQSGIAYYQDDCRKKEMEKQVTEENFTRLTEIINQYASFTFQSEKQPQVSDAMDVNINFRGKGQERFENNLQRTTILITLLDRIIFELQSDNPISEPTIQANQVIPDASSSADPINPQTGWKIYSGETIYTNDGSSAFTIEYPPDWTREKDKLYPEGNKNNGEFILGAGGREAPPPQKVLDLPAGKANYFWSKGDQWAWGYTSLADGNLAYIFYINNIPSEKSDAYEEIFSRMLNTLNLPD